MAQTRRQIDPRVQERLQDMASELRTLIYGELACPVWGTKFAEIESEGMGVGLELARLLMEQSPQEQTQHMPEGALDVDGQTAQPAGSNKRILETEAGAITWREPQACVKRRDFFPSGQSVGD